MFWVTHLINSTHTWYIEKYVVFVYISSCFPRFTDQINSKQTPDKTIKCIFKLSWTFGQTTVRNNVVFVKRLELFCLLLVSFLGVRLSSKHVGYVRLLHALLWWFPTLDWFLKNNHQINIVILVCQLLSLWLNNFYLLSDLFDLALTFPH